MSIPDPRLELVWKESVRALEQQAAALESLRTRAGVILSAAAVTSSLFGAQILRDGSLTCWSWAALLLFTLSAGLSVWVLRPRGPWFFVTRVPDMLRLWVDDDPYDLDSMRREGAVFNQENWDHNQWHLKRLYRGFQWASLFLTAEVVVWLIDLAER